MTGPHPDTGANGVQALDPQQLGAYFALMEAVSLLQHQVEQHLRTEGGLSYVQFQLLARLAEVHGQLTMTQLADGVVYSRSGLTYQASLLEKAGLITRAPSPDDERATLVTITENGLALVDRVLPGHIQDRAPPAVRPTDRRRPAPPRRHHDPRTRPHARPATPLRRPPQTPPQPHPSAPGGRNQQRAVDRVVGADPCRGRRPDS